MKKIALGNSDFKTLIDDNRYFVDKSLLIKEVLDDSAQIVLIPRPRRFGKTLNLSMIRYFVERCDEDRRYLFNNLLIEKEEDIMKKKTEIWKGCVRCCPHTEISATGPCTTLTTMETKPRPVYPLMSSCI